jgi:hypothetical protein
MTIRARSTIAAALFLLGCGGRLTTVGADAGACHTLGLFGATVTMNNEPSSFASGPGDVPPPPATYVLESATRYTGPGGASGVVETLSATVRVTGSEWQVALAENGAPARQRTYRVDPVASGAYRLVGVCGTSDVNDVSFVPLNSLGFVVVVHNKDKSDIVELFRPLMK